MTCKEILLRSCSANTKCSVVSASAIVCNNQFTSSLFTTSFSSQLTIRFFSLNVVHDVPGVTTGRNEFRALLGQLGEHVLAAFVDEGHACKVHHALALPAGSRCSRPGGPQFRNPRMNESAFHRPLLFGRCLGNGDS